MSKHKNRPLLVANAQGFWGDRPGAAAAIVERKPEVDYLTLDYLSEVSLSILAIQREKDPKAGYARDFLDVVDSLIPAWKRGLSFKIVTNAGGLNPEGCAEAIKELLMQKLGRSMKIGIVAGDDMQLTAIENRSRDWMAHLDTKEPFDTVVDRLVTANAYLGARPIVDALNQGAEIVITGRVADPSLTVAPCIAHYQWPWDAYDLIAQATVAGHLIECGTQATGGISTNWLEIPHPDEMGFPIAEVHADGSLVITKPQQTGGAVNIQTVKEQLLYEIGDPSAYLSPDVTVSFLGIEVEQVSENRVSVRGARGTPPSNYYKVSATYRDGYKAEAMLAVFGPEAAKKARLCGKMIIDRVEKAGFPLKRYAIECLGGRDVVPGVFREDKDEDLIECILRVCVADDDLKAMERFSKEVAPLVTSGPQGITGYTSGRPHIRPIFGFWPCLVPCDLVTPNVKLLEAIGLLRN